jgi:hypothetical protein
MKIENYRDIGEKKEVINGSSNSRLQQRQSTREAQWNSTTFKKCMYLQELVLCEKICWMK